MKPSLARRWSALAGVALVLGAVLLARTWLWPPARSAPERELWMYEGVNLASEDDYRKVEPLWRRAAAAGYSRIVLFDQKFTRPAAQDAAYLERVRQLRLLAAGLKLEIIPGTCLVGRGNGAMLANDPNLAEALPVRDAVFEVHGGVAFPVADPPVTLGAKPDRVDAGITLDGNGATIPGGNRGRVAWTITVAPWHLYHVSVRLRGADFRGEPRLRVTGSGQEIAWALVRPPRGDAPETRDVVFNSQDNRSVDVWLSLSPSSKGSLTWSDWRIEEPGPVNVIRRSGMAFGFAGLTEGADYDAVSDPGLGTSGGGAGAFDAWHVPPPIRVRRPDGTRLRASWWSAGVILKGQASVCLSDPAALAMLRSEVARTRQLWGARTVMLMHDEIRVIGQDLPCTQGGRTSGEILAANVRACRGFAGDARVCVWNDMFDPNHNAVDRFYLVRGSLKGSWEGLDPDVTVVNWNGDKPEASLRFFADRGHPQVYAGYYDGPVESIRSILPILDRTPRVLAVMYTTWENRYDDLEAFARTCREPR